MKSLIISTAMILALTMSSMSYADSSTPPSSQNKMTVEKKDSKEKADVNVKKDQKETKEMQGTKIQPQAVEIVDVPRSKRQ